MRKACWKRFVEFSFSFFSKRGSFSRMTAGEGEGRERIKGRNNKRTNPVPLSDLYV
jgi:hypothetical protein